MEKLLSCLEHNYTNSTVFRVVNEYNVYVHCIVCNCKLLDC